MGNNIACTVNCDHILAATFYTLETWFVSGISLSIRCIKVINGDNDKHVKLIIRTLKK
jgi:hypothetical protein